MEAKVKYQISSQKTSLEELTVAHHCHSAISHLQRAISYYNAGMDEPLDWALDAAFREVLAGNQSQPRYQEPTEEEVRENA